MANPFQVPIFFPPNVNVVGQYIADLIRLKGQERGITPPPSDQVFLQAFYKALTDAIKDKGFDLMLQLVDLPLEKLQLPPELRDVIDSVLKSLHSAYGNADQAWQDFWNQISGAGSHFFDTALYANYQSVTPPFQPYKLPLQLMNIGVVSSSDPNDKIGSRGVGTQKFVSSLRSLSYAVDFGNEPTASAPAQKVVVVDQVDVTKADPKTLSWGPITFMNQLLSPPAGSGDFSTTVDLRPGSNLLVTINAHFNQASGMLTWTFQSLDPSTMQPPSDPDVGFLPPGGNGSVFFMVNPKTGLPTETDTSNQATVVFDANPPINTQTWVNTIDNSPPTSHVAALPSGETCFNFKVSWLSTDVGAGIQDVTIFVSDNGGPFTAWLTNTTTMSATFGGQAGHRYAFYSIARDLVGNVESTKTAAEATTQVSSTPACVPTLSGAIASKIKSGTTLMLNLQLSDSGSGDANNVLIKQVTPRTLGGSGTVSLTSPILPTSVGNLAAGTSRTLGLTLNVPSTVTKFSITENGTLQDSAGNTYNYSIAQVVFP